MLCYASRTFLLWGEKMALSLGYSGLGCCGSKNAKEFVEKSDAKLFWIEAVASVALVILGILGCYGGHLPCAAATSELLLGVGLVNTALLFFVAKYVLNEKLQIDNLKCREEH